MKQKKKINKRVLIGAGCAVASVLLCFVIAPIMSSALSKTVEVVAANEFIKRGDLISPSSLKVIKINRNAVPEGAILDVKDVQMKYSGCDIYPMDVITKTKLQQSTDTMDSLFWELGEYTAYSLKLDNLSNYVGGHIDTGDVVSIVIDLPSGKTMIPPSLKYVKVITMTSSDGKDKTGNDPFLPANVTLLLTEDQAVELSGYAVTRDISLLLRAKSGTDYSKILLSEQAEYLKGENS